MKKSLSLLLSISICLTISAQNLELISAARGESPKAFLFNCIFESEDTLTNNTSGIPRHSYKYLKHNLSLKNYSYQKEDKYSPVLAGLLAIVPGAGHFYINEPLRGLVYFGSMGASVLLMTGGLILALDGSILGTSITLIGAAGFVGFYIMNINNAVKFAKLKNLAFRNKYFSLKVLPDLRINNNVTCSNNIGLSLKMTF